MPGQETRCDAVDVGKLRTAGKIPFRHRAEPSDLLSLICVKSSQLAIHGACQAPEALGQHSAVAASAASEVALRGKDHLRRQVRHAYWGLS